MIAIRRVISRRNQGRNSKIKKTFHHNLACKRTGESRVLSGCKQRNRKHNARNANAQQRTEQFVGFLDLGHVLMPGPMKHCCCNDQNRRVNEQREHERKGGVDCRKFDRLPPAPGRLLELARLHN